MVADFCCHTEGVSCITAPNAADAVVVEFLVRFMPLSSVFKLAIVGVGGAEVLV